MKGDIAIGKPCPWCEGRILPMYRVVDAFVLGLRCLSGLVNRGIRIKKVED